MSDDGAPEQRLDQLTRRALEGDVEGSVGELRRIVADSPDYDAAWFALGMVLSSAGRWREASDALARAVELDGNVARMRMAYARALEKNGRLDDAAFQLLKAERLAPDDVRPLKELGAVFYRKGLYDKSVQFYARARGLAPTDARVFYALGLAQEARRDPGAAIAAYRESIALDPKFADARKTLADVLAQMGEHEQAIATLDELLRLERANEQAALNREILAKALGEMRARRLLGRTEREVETSALVQEGQLKRRGHVPRADSDPERVVSVVRYGTGLSEMLVGLSSEGIVARLMLVLPDPDKAAKKRDEIFRVTVVGAKGTREPANYATAVTLTFLREALGAPMTQASELYARLLGGEPVVEWGGARLSFASVPRPERASETLHGLSVTLLAAADPTRGHS
ncbi:MAG TPA: tetratricopeptide repeat protein [Polyangiaceae bacterium]|nr:tetratricopeptide repeat protein [Polyangiaceae bacterium]